MKKIIATTAAPAAIGPYSQGIDGGSVVITSGQLPIDPATGAFAEGGVAGQTRQSLENVKNEVYATFFPSEPPARSAVEVARLPKDALVEIEAIAVR